MIKYNPGKTPSNTFLNFNNSKELLRSSLTMVCVYPNCSVAEHTSLATLIGVILASLEKAVGKNRKNRLQLLVAQSKVYSSN